jgi:transposase
MRFAGIDVASQTHVVAVVDETAKVLVKPTAFAEDAAGYHRLFTILGTPSDILVVLEATGHYGRNLLVALDEKGFRSCLLNPVRTRRFAQEDMARAKTDSIDALGIARFAAQKRPWPTPAVDTATDELRELVRLYERLNQDFFDRVRQIHRLVHLCFPEFKRYVRTVRSQRSAAILSEYSSARAFTDSCLPELARIRYDGRHYVGEVLARTLVEAAKVSVGRCHGSVYSDEMRYLCGDLNRLRAKLSDIKAQIEHKLPEHPVGSLLTSIEGVGHLSAARIIAAVGNPARFRNGAALAAYAGVVPGTKSSGLRRPGRASLCSLGNARLRQALYMTTLGAVRRNPWLRAYYERLKANGKLPKVALVAAMRKLLLAVYAVAKSGQPFTPRPQ